MKIIRQIEFTGKNLNDVFNLPCVKRIIKGIRKKPVVALYDHMVVNDKHYPNIYCYVGDILVEYDNCKWDVIHHNAK